MQNDDPVPKATASVPEAEELIAPGTPIQFDIVLPATEFLDQNRGSRYGLWEFIPEEMEINLTFLLSPPPSSAF